MTDMELADRIAKVHPSQDYFACTDEERQQIIAALRRGPLLCSRCLIQVESHGELYERPPSGEMVMVPREPTDAMRAAGYQQYVSADKRGYSAWQDHLAVYRAMLSAAEAEGRKS